MKLTKEILVVQLKTYSSLDNPLDSMYFFKNYGEYEKYMSLRAEENFQKAENTLNTFRRQLASLVEEINEDQKTYKEFVILSVQGGYYIPKTEDEFYPGREFIMSRAKKLIDRARFIDEMRIRFVNRGKGDVHNVDLFSAGL